MPDLVYEWDEEKAESNYAKHGVDFVVAIETFADPFAIEMLDPRNLDHGETRTVMIGMGGGALLTVVYTERGDAIRIISARRATKREHDDYYIQNSPI